MTMFRKSDGNGTTRHQKGKRWATGTLLFCGAFSIWANVRSGQMNAESIVVSAVLPIVAFLTSHLISYFNPTKIGHKVMIWGGFGFVTLFAMYGSGWHIYDYVTSTGQHWTTGIAYIFVTDFPMLFAAAILVQKVPTAKTSSNRTSAAKSAPKKTTPTKAASVKKATTRATTPNAKNASNLPSAIKVPDIMMDPFEKEMLNT